MSTMDKTINSFITSFMTLSFSSFFKTNDCSPPAVTAISMPCGLQF
jgi:hypothetical protein